MRQPFILTFSALAALSISAVAHAEFSRSGQTLSAALAELLEDINGMNNILASVTSKETAEAAAPKLREQASRFYTDYQKVKQLKLSDTPTPEEEAQLNQQALEIQLAQAAFEQHCLRLVENQFYESAALARFFQAMVNVYQGQNTRPAPQPQEEEYTPEQKRRIEERKKRDKDRESRLKLYQRK